MQQLTDEGRQVVTGVAQRHGFSTDAVTTMLLAVSAGYGNQAQFNHPEFGGMGQWSSGGMVMIGDMFNNYLKGRVSALCQELAGLIQGQALFAMPGQSQSQSQGGGWQGQGSSNQNFGGGQQQSQGGHYGQGGQYGQSSQSGSSLFIGGSQPGNWWPASLGSAGSTGSQNNLRYAYFPGARRLAIDVNGQVTLYDTGDHQIGGFGQQQSGDQSLTFSSQFGLVRVADLAIVQGSDSGRGAAVSMQLGQAPGFVASPADAPPVSAGSQASTPPTPPRASAIAPAMTADEIFGLIEKLADLHAKGILTDTEFETKKQDMLSRL